ncbi:MAG: hypothetical protein EOO67_03630 [Microbacterium sp.]|nr:MAG: hypothetical protein EOO67_03630 [Microbacterium sp.]
MSPESSTSTFTSVPGGPFPPVDRVASTGQVASERLTGADAFVRREIPRLAGASDARERERARRQGHALGYAEGLRAAAAQAELATERAEAERRAARAADAHTVDRARLAVEIAAVSLKGKVDAITEVAEEKIWALAIELAETILERELSDPVRAARTALARAENAVGGAAEAVVIISDVDLATLDALDARPRSEGTGLRIESSAGLSSGDAVVHVGDGQVDLQVRAALRRARLAISAHTPLDEGASS